MNKETIKRFYHTFRLCLILSSEKRADYIRRNNIFHSMGYGCTIMKRKIPLCSKLISLGNNVHLASDVSLVTHDAIHLCLQAFEKSMGGENDYKEKIGCIEIGDNVFVGTNSIILYNVKIGSKVIIGAGSIVNKDIPDNSVAVGVPARIIGTFDDFMNKRRRTIYPEILTPKSHYITKDLEDFCWKDFYAKRK